MLGSLGTGGHRAALLVLCLAFASACAASRAPVMASSTMAQPATAPAAPLDRSLFARDPNGALTEEDLQRILAAPIELELPARVGVLPITTATDWRGPSPDAAVPAGTPGFVKALRKDPAFSLVTETMVIPSGALGMEALREIAARYRLRYILLYREVLAKEGSLNPWAWGYITGIGALFLPGQRQEVFGYIESSMFDVKTGLLMFTTRRAVSGSQHTNQWRTDAKMDQLASTLTSTYSPDLAKDVLADLRRFATAAVAENEQRRGTAVVSVPPALEPTPVATDP